VTAPELTLSERQGPELRDTWQRRISPQQRGEVWGHETRGSAGAHLNKEARSGTAGHVAALKSTSAGWCGPRLQRTWQLVEAHPAPYL
jgi:hypothetical protein